MTGFLHTGATFQADLNLLVQVAMGLALLGGALLARRRNFRGHAACQTSVLLLNLVMIAVVMAPSFHQQVSPHLAHVASDRFYGIAAAHAALGTIAELLGLYVALVAGTQLVPQALRFRNYRLWMRTTLALWWIVIGLGVGTYLIWYTGERAAPATTAAAITMTRQITIQNFSFDPAELTIPAGTTVRWVDSLGRHSVEAVDGSFKSDTLVAGGAFERRFDTPGTYPYFCGFHGHRDGSGMSGKIIVGAR